VEQCDDAAVAGAVDLAHPPGAEQRVESVWPQRSAGWEPPQRRRHGRVAELARALVAGEQRVHLGAQRCIAVTGLGEVRLARVRLTCQRGVEDIGDVASAFGRHGSRDACDDTSAVVLRVSMRRAAGAPRAPAVNQESLRTREFSGTC